VAVTPGYDAKKIIEKKRGESFYKEDPPERLLSKGKNVADSKKGGGIIPPKKNGKYYLRWRRGGRSH